MAKISSTGPQPQTELLSRSPQLAGNPSVWPLCCRPFPFLKHFRPANGTLAHESGVAATLKSNESYGVGNSRAEMRPILVIDRAPRDIEEPTRLKKTAVAWAACLVAAFNGLALSCYGIYRSGRDYGTPSPRKVHSVQPRLAWNRRNKFIQRIINLLTYFTPSRRELPSIFNFNKKLRLPDEIISA